MRIFWVAEKKNDQLPMREKTELTASNEDLDGKLEQHGVKLGFEPKEQDCKVCNELNVGTGCSELRPVKGEKDGHLWLLLPEGEAVCAVVNRQEIQQDGDHRIADKDEQRVVADFTPSTEEAPLIHLEEIEQNCLVLNANIGSEMKMRARCLFLPISTMRLMIFKILQRRRNGRRVMTYA